MLDRHIAIKVGWRSSLTFAALGARIRPRSLFLVIYTVFLFRIIKYTLEPA